MNNVRLRGPDRKSGPNNPGGNSVLQNRVFETVPCTLFSLIVTNHHATDDKWLFILDSATVPLTDDISHIPPIKIAAGATAFVDVSTGIRMSAGISLGCSTDPLNYAEEPTPCFGMWAAWTRHA